MIQGKTYTLHIGNNLDILPTLPDNSVDSIVTDPPYELGFMGKKWDSSGIAYSVELWTQCLRVLKPGGHLLSFGGTRTWHRVAVAIEDAGFEVRDSIAWMYGSGFPKSLDVSKAIDKAAGVEREVIGQKITGNARTEDGWAGGQITVDETAPSTPEAKQWEGWGTALKPAFEPVVVARKPLGGEIAVRSRIENELNKLGFSEIVWTKPVSDVKSPSQAKTSGLTSQPKMAATSVRTASEPEMQNTEPTIESFTGKLPEDSTNETQADQSNLLESQSKDSKTKSSKLMDRTVNAVESPTEPSSRSTTSTAVAHSTENAPKEMFGQSLGVTDSLTVTESFAGIATGLSGSLANVLINRLSDGSFEWPTGLPEVYKVGSTVAENVLTYGTGGLNIDGSRIGTSGGTQGASEGPQGQVYGNGLNGERGKPIEGLGRWPANVILDEYTAELLDEQSGASRFFYVAKASKRDRNEGLEDLADTTAGNMVDREEGSAGMNSPRAGAGRTSGAKNFHPTVKPTDLMRYLIKLVTPPGGVVLDPFTGSGSTGKAAILEGFRFIGCELTEDYIPIIEGRLKHAEAMAAEAEAKKEEALF